MRISEFDVRETQMMAERNQNGQCAECAVSLHGTGQLASVPGYPPNLEFCEACLREIGEALASR